MTAPARKSRKACSRTDVTAFLRLAEGNSLGKQKSNMTAQNVTAVSGEDKEGRGEAGQNTKRAAYIAYPARVVAARNGMPGAKRKQAKTRKKRFFLLFVYF